MLTRPATRYQGGVRRIGCRGIYALYCFGVAPFCFQASDVGNLETVIVGMEIEFRRKFVYRDYNGMVIRGCVVLNTLRMGKTGEEQATDEYK